MPLMSGIPAQIFLVIIGVILILLGSVSTPIFPTFGNDAFWLGTALLVIGILTIILPAIL